MCNLKFDKPGKEASSSVEVRVRSLKSIDLATILQPSTKDEHFKSYITQIYKYYIFV